MQLKLMSKVADNKLYTPFFGLRTVNIKKKNQNTPTKLELNPASIRSIKLFYKRNTL